MIKYLLLPIFLLSFSTSFCQEKKLLEEYKFRIKNYKALNTLFGAGASQRRSESNGLNKNADISGNIEGAFFKIKSSDNFYQESTIALSTLAFTEKNASKNNEQKSSQYNFKPKVEIINRWFKKNNYVELGGNIDADLSNYRRTEVSNNYSAQINKIKNIEAKLVVGIGKGRIENIVDMQNAIWLNKISMEEGNLDRSLTESEILGLANTITGANNYRIIDGRKRIKFILKKVDEYLQSKLLVKKTDVEYFSNLNDIIFFVNNFSRKAGSIKFVKLIPLVNINNEKRNYISNTITKNIIIETSSSLNLKIGTENYKPLGLKHQINYGVAANIGLGNFDYSVRDYTNTILTNEVLLNNNSKAVSLDYFVGFDFYPNTRTNVGCTLTGNFGYAKGNGESNFTNAILLKTSANYFISYNTRLSLNLNTAYNQYSFFKNGSQFLNGNNLNLYFNTGLNISL